MRCRRSGSSSTTAGCCRSRRAWQSAGAASTRISAPRCRSLASSLTARTFMRGTGCRRCSGSRHSSSRPSSRPHWRRAATRLSARRWCRRWRWIARRHCRSTTTRSWWKRRIRPPSSMPWAICATRRRCSGRRIASACMNSPLAKRHAVVRAGGRVVCTAQIAVDGELAGVFDVITAPDARRQGYATLACASLLSWAWQHGAHAAYLQVSADNAPAIASYRRVRLRDGLHLPLPRPAGGMRMSAQDRPKRELVPLGGKARRAKGAPTSDDSFALAERLGRVLVERRWTVATAESCTGGLIAGAITDVAGSSAWFDRGFVTYSNEAKSRDARGSRRDARSARRRERGDGAGDGRRSAGAERRRHRGRRHRRCRTGGGLAREAGGACLFRLGAPWRSRRRAHPAFRRRPGGRARGSGRRGAGRTDQPGRCGLNAAGAGDRGRSRAAVAADPVNAGRGSSVWGVASNDRSMP